MLTPLRRTEKLNLLTNLLRTQELEQFIYKKFSYFKRYSLEGSEATIAGKSFDILTVKRFYIALHTMFAEVSNKESEVDSIVLGTTFRGRSASIVFL